LVSLQTNLNRSTNEASYNYAAANFGGELPSKPYFKVSLLFVENVVTTGVE